PSSIPSAHPQTYALSLHDALPIFRDDRTGRGPDGHIDRSLRMGAPPDVCRGIGHAARRPNRVGLLVEHADRRRDPARADMAVDRDRKSTRLNSSHGSISYAVFRLK